ncbi:MAG: hypothetical protein EXR77_07315 [Myxococcales bacterium]|nr:hypothetical protein [Myxococcales bacterium]
MKPPHTNFGSLTTIALLIAAAASWPTTAWAAFCTGKQNGLWCDGNNLVNCQNGSQTSSKACGSGCQSMPTGVADQCKSTSGSCAAKLDGAWCDGSNLLQCKGGGVSSSQACQYGCQAMPAGVADECKGAPAPTGPCAGKPDGAYCNGSSLMQCKGGGVVSSQTCANGCEVKPPGVADVCKSEATTATVCTGKADGSWCAGDGLLQCGGGKVSSSKTCTYGCQSMPPGLADQCKGAPASTGPCTGKSDGQWCDGDKVLTCSGGQATHASACANGCQTMPSGVADQCKPAPQPSGPCTGAADGEFCDGATLRVCKGGQQVGSQICELGCQSDGGANCTQPPFDPQKSCAGKADGAWCVGSQLASCKAGKVANAFNCPTGCQAMPSGVPDTCKKPGGDAACAGKFDGTWCSGGDLIQCSNGLIAKAISCAKGCAQPSGGAAACNYKTAGYCSGKQDGAWCDGPLLTACKLGATQSVFACPGGCQQNAAGVADACKSAATPSKPSTPSGSANVGETDGCATFDGGIDLWQGKGLKVWNQKDYGQQLGTCPGLTIHNSGCTITSLAMLHAYLGVKRHVDGQEGDDPVLENAWRKQYGGYAASDYEMGGKQVSGKCLVIWGSAPAGLVPAHGSNASTTCISPKAASFIVNALKSGMPVVAGVHWPGGNSAFYGTSEDWHWVLIVGVDQGGPLINDPWGGKERVHLSEGGLGKYIIDDLYVFWQPGQQQGGMAPPPLNENGEPTTEDELPKTIEYIDETPPTVVVPAPDAQGSDSGGDTHAEATPSANAGGLNKGASPTRAGSTSGCSANPASFSASGNGGASGIVAALLATLAFVGIGRRLVPMQRRD